MAFMIEIEKKRRLQTKIITTTTRTNLRTVFAKYYASKILMTTIVSKIHTHTQINQNEEYLRLFNKYKKIIF
jgi:hypothetical protein